MSPVRDTGNNTNDMLDIFEEKKIFKIEAQNAAVAKRRPISNGMRNLVNAVLIFCCLLLPSSIFFLPSVISAADAIQASLTLGDAEQSAENHSQRLKSLKYEQKAAEERSSYQKTLGYPKLALDGSYRYITSVQEITLPIPNSNPVKFGDNSNYSIGPLLTWTAWDSGGVFNAHKSATAAAEARKNEAEAMRRQVVFSARSAYFQLALAGEQVMLYADALKLSSAQYEDIRINVRAGTKSRADELKAHQEVLARMKQLRQTQADMASALSDLSALTGAEYAQPKLESLDSMLGRFEPYMDSKLDEKHPALEVFAKSAEASGYAAKSAGSGNWPKVQLSAKSSMDYPNGTKLESYNQNTFSATLNWALFEFGAVKNRVNESENAMSAGLQRRGQALSDFRRDWAKTMEQLSNLRDQKKMNEISVAETDELSKIIYKTYKSGSISFLEVENVNFKALEAKIQSARTKVQMLMNLAVIANLAE
ncbi:MAG: TolC family protein [Elusimicrobiota bacterium]